MDAPQFILIVTGIGAVLALMVIIFRFAKWDQSARREHQLRKYREQTYAEIAAYVAEGTISPADAERMMKAMGDLSAQDKVNLDLQTARMKG